MRPGFAYCGAKHQLWWEWPRLQTPPWVPAGLSPTTALWLQIPPPWLSSPWLSQSLLAKLFLQLLILRSQAILWLWLPKLLSPTPGGLRRADHTSLPIKSRSRCATGRPVPNEPTSGTGLRGLSNDQGISNSDRCRRKNCRCLRGCLPEGRRLMGARRAEDRSRMISSRMHLCLIR